MPPKGALPPGWYCKCPSCDSRHGPTPQVREGPTGPRTMCNKCAVNWFRTWKENKTPEEVGTGGALGASGACFMGAAGMCDPKAWLAADGCDSLRPRKRVT